MQILHHETAESEMDFTHDYNRFHKNVDTIYWKISAFCDRAQLKRRSMRVVERFGTLGGRRRNIFRNLSSIKEVVIYCYVIRSFLLSGKICY